MRRLLIGLAITLVTLLLGCGIAELAWRASTDEVQVFRLRNYAEQRLDLFQSAYPSAYDAALGWVPEPGYAGQGDNIWKKRVTIDDAGLRVNGGPAPAGGPLIVAAGDSFTFGDEVHDDETYPAHLERRLGVRVLNAGVFGYGLDQSVLRAERLIERHAPQGLVLQAVVDDVRRMQMRVRTGVAKPYFVLEDGALALKNVPAPPARPSIADVGWARRVFGYSYVVDWSMRRLGHAEWWYVGQWPSAHAYQDEAEATRIGCRLVERLGRTLRARGIVGVFVAQYAAHMITASYENPYTQPVKDVMACAAQAGFRTYDTDPDLRALAAQDLRAFRATYAQVHYAAAGNAWLAERLAPHFASLSPAPSSGAGALPTRAPVPAGGRRLNPDRLRGLGTTTGSSSPSAR